MKDPGFSSERERFLKIGPASKMASEMAALSLSSPALMETVAAPVLLSVAHWPFTDAFHIVGGERKWSG